MDKERLLAKRPRKTREVEIPDVGTVTVRGLTRAEVKEVRRHKEDEYDLRVIAAGLVDPPDMTVEEVDQWFEDAPLGEFVAVLTAITELSGISEGAQKSVVRKARQPRRR